MALSQISTFPFAHPATFSVFWVSAAERNGSGLAFQKSNCDGIDAVAHCRIGELASYPTSPEHGDRGGHCQKMTWAPQDIRGQVEVGTIGHRPPSGSHACR